jgi:hypothetical protein
MKGTVLPSASVPDSEKSLYSEAEVHARLFEPDMRTLGYPPRTNTQADGEHFAEQGALALRRLKTGQTRGRFDGLYLIGNSPVLLCEIKRYDALDSSGALQIAVTQLKGYALSQDFSTPPPFLLLYCGKPSRTRFYRRRLMADGSLLDGVEYEELPELWDWARIKDAHVRGSFAEEVVDRRRLLELLRHHLDRIEDDIRQQVRQAVEIAAAEEEAPALLASFGRELVANPRALDRMRQLYERKVAEIGGRGGQRRVIEEMVTQASLNYVNKVFFLSLCEDRNLPGFYRIMREFLPATRTETRPTTAAVFLGLLRRKMRDSVGPWTPEEEVAYRELRQELTPEIREYVIEQNNWWKLIRVAFDLAGERFPLVYREDAYDFFRPHPERLAELIYDLSTKSFRGLSNRSVGDLYQGLLSSRRGRGGQQSTLGAFYTPQPDVDYMVSRLELRRDSRVLDPCMGSGHFLEGLLERLTGLYLEDGFSQGEAYREILGSQLFGADIDTFATSLAAIRLFLLDEGGMAGAPNLFVHDMLLHTPERPGRELFSNEMLQAEGQLSGPARAVSVDADVDQIASIDEIAFDAVVGNPPYGARKPKYKERIYGDLYGPSDRERRTGSLGTGDRDSYAMFISNGIERLREGGRLCFITSDTFRSLSTYAPLRRHVLNTCKIVEILLTDTRHFEGVAFQFAGMAITTLEKCSGAEERATHRMRLVDTVRDPERFASPPGESVSEVAQSEYETMPDTPFWVGVPREVLQSARSSALLGSVARGRQGLASAEDRRFLAGVGQPAEGLTRQIEPGELATTTSEDERGRGIDLSKPHWVPFSKGTGTGEYFRRPRVAIDWSEESVAELERRAALPPGTPRKAYLRNRGYYFEAGLTYSVVATGRVTARLLPEGWIIGHKGSGVFVEDPGTSQLFVLGYLNSALATYFMRKIVNTTATADVGYLEKLPYRRPDERTERAVVERVERIIEARTADPDADIESLRDEIDGLVFDLFDVRTSREEVRGLYRRAAVEEDGAQAAEE